MNLLFICFFFLETTTHDIQVAYYKIYQDNNIVHVDFVFEKDDLLHTLDIAANDFINEKIKRYLQKHFALSINKEKHSLEFGAAKVNDKHINIKASSSTPNQLIKTVEIINTCLLDIDKHSNIMKIRFHELERDFLMDARRTSITVDY